MQLQARQVHHVWAGRDIESRDDPFYLRHHVCRETLAIGLLVESLKTFVPEILDRCMLSLSIVSVL
jgi:hypothetical protein